MISKERKSRVKKNDRATRPAPKNPAFSSVSAKKERKVTGIYVDCGD